MHPRVSAGAIAIILESNENSDGPLRSGWLTVLAGPTLGFTIRSHLVQPGADKYPQLICRSPKIASLWESTAISSPPSQIAWILPDYDYWGNVGGLITAAGVRLDLDNLFRHNNEQNLVMPSSSMPPTTCSRRQQYRPDRLLDLRRRRLRPSAAPTSRSVLRETPARWALCG